MNSIIREDINYMIMHARRVAKRSLSIDDKKERLDFMKSAIERDFNLADGAISALDRAGIISFIDYIYARRVLKHHYCRLLAAYCEMNYMYKGDKDFYFIYLR